MWWLAGMAAVQAGAGILNARAQAAQQRREAEEQLRRQTLQDEAMVGDATALAGASGVEVTSTSSLSRYLTAMTAELRRERLWAEDAALRGAAATETAGLLGGAADLGRGLFQAGQMSNWGRKPNSSSDASFSMGWTSADYNQWLRNQK